MRNFIKNHWLVTSILFVALAASAAKIGEDLLKIGKPGSTSDKQIVFDVGDGATNPSITIDFTDKDFTFNKALKVTEDLLQVGDGTNTDKDFIFDIGNGATNPRFRWNSTNSILEFSLDGSSFKKIGSGAGGGGGGTNALQENNFDFETGTPPDDWTASGGTFIAETTAPLFGAASGSWDASSLAQTLDSVLAPITTGFLGNSCQAEIDYIYASGSAGDYKMVVRQYDDSGATEITVAEIDLGVTTTKRKAQLFFDCPDDVADDLRIRIEAGVADPGVGIFDNAFIGTGRNTFQLSQTEIIGTAFYPPTGACFWSTSSGPTLADFGVDSDCPVPTLTGKALAPDTKIPGVKFAELTPAKYRVDVSAFFLAAASTAGNQGCSFAISDGTSQKGLINVFSDLNQGSASDSTTYAIFEYATQQSDLQFSVVAGRSSGNGICHLSNEITDARQMFMAVTKYPLSSADAVTMETVGWHIDANLGGANPVMSIGSQSSWVDIADSGLDLVINPGSQTAQIPCTGGNTATGLTCSSGDENVGISFVNETAGRYKVCMEFAHFTSVGATSAIDTTFQLVETQETDATVLIQEGKSRVLTGQAMGAGTGGGANDVQAYNLCGTFEWPSVSKRTIRLLYEQVVSGTISSSILRADRSAALGDRDVHITVEKMDQQFPTPIFKDLQNSLDSKIEAFAPMNLFSSDISCAPTVTINSEAGGDWIASGTRHGTGDCSVNFQAGAFATGEVHCQCTAATAEGQGRRYCARSKLSSCNETACRFKMTNETGANIDDGMVLTCSGVRP